MPEPLGSDHTADKSERDKRGYYRGEVCDSVYEVGSARALRLGLVSKAFYCGISVVLGRVQ